MTVGLYDDGRPGEIFVKINKEGSTVSGLMDAVALLTSVTLQYGVPIEDLARKLKNTRFEPYGRTDNRRSPGRPSLVDYVFRWLELKFAPHAAAPDASYHTVAGDADAPIAAPIGEPTGLGCPDCGARWLPGGLPGLPLLRLQQVRVTCGADAGAQRTRCRGAACSPPDSECR